MNFLRIWVLQKKARKDQKGQEISGRKGQEKAAGKAEAIKRKANMTDSESRIQKTSKGYNAQAVATEDRIVIACDVVNEANDIHPLWLDF